MLATARLLNKKYMHLFKAKRIGFLSTRSADLTRNVMTLDSVPSGNFAEEEIPEIVGYRRAHHADIPRICQMMTAKNYDLFGDVEPAQLFERACLSMVQINEKQEIVSNVSLCNFPNVPAIPAPEWLSWITMHYEVPDIIERNTLFIHLLVWDCRYEATFFKTLLENIFAVTSNCLYVIIVMPPGIAKREQDIFQECMTRVAPRNLSLCKKVQTLFVGLRQQHYPKLQIRRLVEEDNDDLIPIIDAESKSMRALYGEFYISEMMRYPGEGNRQLIVAESEGLATGVMCLNKIVDVDLLNEIFELEPYKALRKPLPEETSISGSSSASSIVNKTASEDLSPDSAKDRAKLRWSVAVAQVIRNSQQPIDESDDENDSEDSSTPDIYSARSSERFSGISASVDFASRRTSIFTEAISELPVRSLASSGFNEDDDSEEEDLAISQYTEKMERKLSLKPPQGEINAFTLELFSMDKKIDEQHGREYLEAAFECFPDLEYCVMLLPSTHPFFPFVGNFARVPLRFDKDFPMVLYVAHRATLLGFLQCREANSNDCELIEDFLRDIPKKNAILEDFNAAVGLENREKVCYVFMCENRLIGLSIVCAEPHIDQLRIMYNLEEYISLENTARDAHARLLHFILVPMFSIHHRFFFCELMRLSCTTAIYYRLYDSETMALNRTQPLVTCLDSMIHVKNRTLIYDPWPQGVKKCEENDADNNFSLFLINPRIAMLPKRVINAKIIVVGASDCGIAFAEFLALQGSSSDIVHFTNVTLISPNGLPFEREGTLEHATMIPFSGRYCYPYAKVVPSRVWINVVHGTVSHINRKDKHVTVFGLGNLTYDFLVLTCGLRYASPKFHREDKDSEPRRSLQRDTIPLNCFCVNDDDDASTCLESLKELTDDFTVQQSIVIYGHNIQSYCTLSTLLELGMPGKWITLIQPQMEPAEKRSDIFFENEEVDEAVENAIRENGVKVLEGWNLKYWILESTDIDGYELKESNVIKSLKLQGKIEKKLVACDVLIFFCHKTINMKTFMAISKAGLVFDGRLVINPEYETNDPNIFAAGTMAKYSRKYHAEHLQHEYYNSIEIGERLASNLKQKIDFQPHVDEEKKLPDSKSNAQSLLPVFRAPIIVYCILPGGFHYLHVRKPGKRIPRAIHIASGTYGDVLETGSALIESEIGYFRIRLNQFNRIETLTCFSKKCSAYKQLSVLFFVLCFLTLLTIVLIHHHQFNPIKAFRVQDLITLYGKHDSMLNNLKIRFQNSLVPDLYAYFTEPWTAALFHDKFDCLRVENRATLLSKTGILGGSLVDDAMSAFIKSNWKEMSAEDRRYIESRFQGSVYQNGISSALINFLQAEEELLPMYCNPRKLRRQLMDEVD